MSHVVKIDIEIRDLQALKQAAAKIGLEFREGQRTYKWFGQSVGDYPIPEGADESQLGKCDHAISIPGNKRAYEVGVVRDGDRWRLLWDFWSGGYGLQEAIGQDGSKLMDAYAIEAARNAAMQIGWLTEDTTNGLRVYHPDGGTLDVTGHGIDANGFMGHGCSQATGMLSSSMGNVAQSTSKPEAYQSQQRINVVG